MMDSKRIKLGDLPTQTLLNKLIRVSFSTPQKNMQVFKYFQSVSKSLVFLENEKLKLLRKYGDPKENGNFWIPKDKTEEFKEELQKLMDVDVTEDICLHGLTEDDFMDENCAYSDDKSSWLNASEIAFIVQ